MALEVNIVFLDLFGLIMPYLFGFFFIRGGLRGVKRWPDYVNGLVVNRGSFTSAIFVGALIGIGGSAFFAYRICAKVLGGHIGATMASYLSFIAPSLVIGATAFYLYRYWENYIPDRPSENIAALLTSNFDPGKAYLIAGKDIGQVKKETKEWYQKHEFKILKEDENEIEGRLLNLWARYDVWLYIKFKSGKGGTVLVFNKKYMERINGNMIFLPDLKRYESEWPKNLIRFLSDKKEFELEYFVKYFNLTNIFAIIIFIFIIYDPFNQLSEIGSVDSIIFGIAVSLFTLRFLASMHKLKKTNLQEYRVEEYQDKFIEMAQYYGPIFKPDPDFAYAWYNKGLSYAKDGKPLEALRYLDKSLAINPKSAYTWSNKGCVLYAQRKYSEAVKCYDKAIAIDPNLVFTWNNKGVALIEKGRLSQAIGCYDIAINLDSNYANAWYNKGLALENLRRYMEAQECFNKVAEIDSNSIDTFYTKGWTLVYQGKYSEAIKCYDKAIEINPNSSYIWYYKGRAFFKQGRYFDAIICYDKAIEIDPNYIYAWAEKGLVLEKLGKVWEAQEYFNKAKELGNKE